MATNVIQQEDAFTLLLESGDELLQEDGVADGGGPTVVIRGLQKLDWQFAPIAAAGLNGALQ